MAMSYAGFKNMHAVRAYLSPQSFPPSSRERMLCHLTAKKRDNMSAEVKVCEIDPEVKELGQKFRFRKAQNSAAIVFKIDAVKQLVVLDERHEDISIDDLREELPAHQPRFVLFSYVLKHDDGRVSYPLCFIFISPQGCKPEQHMMYSGSKLNLVKELGATKVFELRSVEEMTEEWLIEKLKFFR